MNVLWHRKAVTLLEIPNTASYLVIAPEGTVRTIPKVVYEPKQLQSRPMDSREALVYLDYFRSHPNLSMCYQILGKQLEEFLCG